MGQASARGNHAERREQSLDRQLDEAEILVFLKGDNGKLTMSMLNRDDPPNQDSPAVIFAAYLSANWEQLAGEAMALYTSHSAATRGELPMEGQVLAAAPTRSLVTPQGDIARVDEAPKLLGPDGEKLQ